MGLLVLFAVIAGAGTALSPCVLPVLPALLSAGATGGRRRPLGIALGLAITFTVTMVGLATVIDGVGLGADATCRLAVVALAGFGVAIMVPAVAGRLEAPLARLARLGHARPGRRLRLGPGRGRGPRLRLRAVRGTDPHRRHNGGRRDVAHGAGRAGLRPGIRARPPAPRLRWACRGRAPARGGPRPRAAARARSGPRRHGGGHGHEPRRALEVGHRRPPAGGHRGPGARAGDLRRGGGPPSRPAPAVALRHRCRPCPPARRRPSPAAAGLRSRIHRHRALVSTRRAGDR
jgi:hypothetical protein